VLEKYPKEVKLVMKHFPLPMHDFARKAAFAALAAAKQGKFWEFHERLYSNQSSLNETKIQEIAKELNLDIEKFNQDLKDQTIEPLIDRDIKDGQEEGVRGTPTIFINGKLLSNRSIQGFQQAIENELKKKK
jgi:protein-disulfide isomerase